MNVPEFNRQIEKLCSTDPTKPYLQQPYLDTDIANEPTLVATDGKMLVAVPVTARKSERGPVPISALQAARKLNESTITLDSTVCTLSDGTKHPRPKSERIPRWREVIPTANPAVRFAINPKQLMAIAKALGAVDGVILEMTENYGPIRITPAKRARGLGLLMPLSKAVKYMVQSLAGAKSPEKTNSNDTRIFDFSEFPG